MMQNFKSHYSDILLHRMKKNQSVESHRHLDVISSIVLFNTFYITSDYDGEVKMVRTDSRGGGSKKNNFAHIRYCDYVPHFHITGLCDTTFNTPLPPNLN
jgi:hypothetical protein